MSRALLAYLGLLVAFVLGASIRLAWMIVDEGLDAERRDGVR